MAVGGGGFAVDASALDRRFATIPADVKKMSLFYVYLISGFAGVGGFIFGYDLGVIGSILGMPVFLQYYYTDQGRSLATYTFDKSWIVSFFVLGCFFGSFINGWLSDRIGRKKTIIFGSFLFTLGGAIQTAAINVPMLYIGRMIAGLAVGGLSMIVPLYQGEMAPAKLRGGLVAIQQLMIVSGVAAAFWIDYVCNLKLPTSQLAFRIPLGVQVVAGLILAFGMAFMPESVRYLMKTGNFEQARKNLALVRHLTEDNLYIQYEYEEIHKVVEAEMAVGQGRWKDLLLKEIRRPLLIGCFLQFFQQLSGTNATTYYAISFYKILGITDTNTQLLLQGFYGLVKIVGTFPALLFLDRFGRRAFLIVGGIGMAICQFALGILIRVVAGNTVGAAVQAAFAGKDGLGKFGVFLIWSYIGFFAWTWGPIPWVYNAEIYPVRHRSKAIALATAADWLGNFIVGIAVPTWLERSAYGPFFFFAVVCTVGVLVTLFFIPETKGVALEEMPANFEGPIWQVGSKKKHFDREVTPVTDVHELDGDRKTAHLA
ncbi:hypothetical protein HK097_008652 [Rhizophlyctis rosea]|uniref:Major facilitator superfamily (MFS) profile domain-containing protein n=1 Tax=Rhizophlyctis rosea TaxID=64517 RepID=A0AAD5SIS9_9FUNG|nr:hypothetical protein HK097_008652 [Rhizophlyctis rosea]